MKSLFKTALLAAAASAAFGVQAQQAFPSKDKTVTIVVPFAAGGPTDRVARDLAEAMNQSCAAVPPEVDEFALAGLTPLASERVAPPRVAESPVTFECRCTQILQLQGADGVQVPSLAGAGRGGDDPHRHGASEGRGVRHGERRAHPARGGARGLFLGGAGAEVQDVPAAVRRAIASMRTFLVLVS